jgi:hypothetical protein
MVAPIVAQSLGKVGRDGKRTDCRAGLRRLQLPLPDALLDADCARLPINAVHLQSGKLALCQAAMAVRVTCYPLISDRNARGVSGHVAQRMAA